MSYAPAFWLTLEDETGARLGRFAGTEVDRRHGVESPGMSWTGGTVNTLECANGLRGLEHAL